MLLDSNLVTHAYLKEALTNLQQKGVIVKVHEINARSEPTYEYLDELKPQFEEGNYDALMGIGGGSVLDITKGIATLLKNGGPSITYRGFPELKNKPLPVIAVPTTAGTGSEITYNAVFISAKEKAKLGINSKLNYPIAAILDPLIIVNAPKHVTVSTGMDALVHTFESFGSRKTNPYSRMFAREAFKLLFPALFRVLDEPADMEIRGNLFLGSHYAGAALMNSSAGPAGAMSYPLGVNFKVPHGMAGAVFIDKIVKLNVQKGFYEYAEFYDLINGADHSLSPKEKSFRLVEELEKLCRKLDIPQKLTVYGVNKDNINIILDQTFNGLKGAVDNNPVEVTKEEIKKYYMR